MSEAPMNIYAASFLWGIFSAVSLPLGALISFFFKLPKRWNCALLAYGAGALLFALTVEIYGEALIEYRERNDTTKIPMIMLAVGSLIGSFLFFVSNYIIENQGGFLRKFALRTNFIRRQFEKRETLRKESLKRDSLRRDSQRRDSANAKPHPKKPSYGTHFLDSKIEYSALRDEENDPAPNPEDRHFGIDDGKTPSWQKPSRIASEDELDVPKEEEIKLEEEFLDQKKEAQVGVAIWLGILIDAFPESLVIGILVRNGISLTFIIGVLVSNFPEALSSSVILRRGGFSKIRIMLMWTSIMLLTGLGSVLGTFAFAGEPSAGQHIAKLTVEGLAAGAMLVMIAETALPEAFRHAGNLVGFSTLFGFLTAYAIKLTEQDPDPPHP